MNTATKKEPTKVRRSHKGMKQEEFRQIKALLDAGLSIVTVENVTNRSYPVVTRVRDSKNIEEYREKTATETLKQKQRILDFTPKADVVGTGADIQLQLSPVTDVTDADGYLLPKDALVRIAEAMERQAKATEALCKAWQAKPAQPKGFFNK